ncbi:MAG: hypothetical protein AVDCRST_MAG59-1751 [uncultured Thermomicrobiales bacterium]|uniref:Uncharacterized protein n=1 Tax=uncultured Thermomicrobiales bacterium TaxID=1645740 RepID=A0A6J4ULD6_9BACT|nr:MAG: hypothetical protein AVDCRST_MAG59-1751 [uncultured Thermomicrobiales bacterium]
MRQLPSARTGVGWRPGKALDRAELDPLRPGGPNGAMAPGDRHHAGGGGAGAAEGGRGGSGGDLAGSGKATSLVVTATTDQGRATIGPASPHLRGAATGTQLGTP